MAQFLLRGLPYGAQGCPRHPKGIEKGAQGVQRGSKRVPKASKRDRKRVPMEPKGAQGIQKGSEKGAQGIQKGSKRVPKASKRERKQFQQMSNMLSYDLSVKTKTSNSNQIMLRCFMIFCNKAEQNASKTGPCIGPSGALYGPSRALAPHNGPYIGPPIMDIGPWSPYNGI